MSTLFFFGTPAFACPSLQLLHADDSLQVQKVLTQPDRPVGRKQVLKPSPVKVLAQKLGIPVLQPEKVAEILQEESAPDFLVVVAYGQKLPVSLLEWPKIAAVNIHPSLLPLWRGASPMQNSLLAGDAETGVTLQRMVKELDAGPILAQVKITIAERETHESLSRKLAERSATLLLQTLKSSLHEIPQDDAQATFCKKLTREDGMVHASSLTAEEIDRRVRALTPWPGVTLQDATYAGVKILSASLVPHPDAYVLPCARGTELFVLTMQSPGKKILAGAEWGRGRKK